MKNLIDLIGKQVTAIGNCGIKKDIDVCGKLSYNSKYDYYLVTIDKENGLKLPCSVYANSIKINEI